MSDEVMKELWEIKDAIAREHGYDVDALVAHLLRKPRPAGQRVVDLSAGGQIIARAVSGGSEKPRG